MHYDFFSHYDITMSSFSLQVNSIESCLLVNGETSNLYFWFVEKKLLCNLNNIYERKICFIEILTKTQQQLSLSKVCI